MTSGTTEGNWNAGNAYAQFAGATGTLTPGSGTGGEVVFGATADNDAVSIRTVAVPFQLIRTGKQFWFECRIKTSTIADTKNDIFVGLMANNALTSGVPITSAGALADVGLVGFFRPETSRSGAGTGGAIMNTVYKASGITAVTVQTDAVALVANTYTKLGIVFKPYVDPFATAVGDGYGKYLLSFYQDGFRLGTQYQMATAAGTDFPNNVSLGLVAAVMDATGSTPGTMTMDWWRAAQLF